MTKKSNGHNGAAGSANRLTGWFSHFAQQTSVWTGHPFAFLLAFTIIVVWIVTGPVFNYSDTWQLVINTGTTIVTFLMVFLIQNTQNRDMMTVQLKLSELVLAMKGAENKFAAIEDLNDDELENLHNECRARAEMTGERLDRRRSAKSGNGNANSNGNPKPHVAAARAVKTRRRSHAAKS